MSKLSTQLVSLFRAGDHGAKGVITEADLDRVVAAYKPGEHEAPVVVGHPRDNGPAYGWVAGIERQGAELFGRFHQVEPTFAEMVEAGRFKKRSASFYTDPATGRITGLRHVGFLGAQPPHVKGLKDIQFDEGVAEVTFEEEVSMAQETIPQDEKALKARFTAWLGELLGTEKKTEFSEADVQRIASEAVTAAVAPLQAQLAAQTASFSESQKGLATATTAQRAADAITTLKSKGKWVPAFDKAGLPLVFAELAKAQDVVEFGEGAAKKSVTPLQAFVNFMEELPVIVPNTTVYTGQTPGGAAPVKREGVNDSQRAPADPNSVAFDAAIQARMRDKNVDYGTAMTQVAEQPNLTKPGGAAAGAV